MCLPSQVMAASYGGDDKVCAVVYAALVCLFIADLHLFWSSWLLVGTTETPTDLLTLLLYVGVGYQHLLPATNVEWCAPPKS